MTDFRFILGKRALIVFLALLVATSAFLGVPAATRTLAESPPPGSQDVSAASADPVAAEEPLLGPSGYSPLLQGGGDTSAWTRVPTTPLSPSSPSARYGHAMAATPSGVLLFGGLGGGFRNDTWLFNSATSTWGLLNTGSASPSKRVFAAMAYDSQSGKMILFGGNTSVGSNDETWLFNSESTGTGTWTKLTITGSNPPARRGHAMVTTPSGVLLFGGLDMNPTYYYFDDTWLFNTGGTGTGTWTKLTTTTSTPSARYNHAMAALPGGNVLLFGGSTDGGNVLFDDTWLFTYDSASKTSAWTELFPTNAPSARYSPAMAYDSQNGKVLLFGGVDYSGYRNDTWLFCTDGTGAGTWTETNTPIMETNTPTARNGHALATTPSRVLLFGGQIRNSVYFNDTWLYGPTLAPTLAVTSPTGNAHWPIGTPQDITWTSTGLDSTTLTILLARDGVHFTETITHGLTSTVTHYTWTVTGPGTINAKIRVQQDATADASPDYFTITATLFPYIGGTTTLTTSDPWLEISGGSGTGTLWVTPLDPQYTSDPDLSQFIEETGKRSALFFDIGQEGLSGTLTIVLHFNHRLGEESFVIFRWDGAKWVEIPGTLNLEDHTFTFSIDTALLLGTPFALGGDPVAMPGMSPWGLALLCLALLGMGGWWFLRRRRIA